MSLTVDDLAPSNSPDNFRVSVGRYGERWYTDPLPACPIASATADAAVYPSVSTIKKASGSDWSFVALKRVADEMTANPARFKGLDATDIYETLKVINKTGLTRAAQRGTDVHTMCEQMLRHGRITSEGVAGDYRAAVERFFATYQPEQRTIEVVAIHRDLNGVGYGGTGDAGLIIDGKLYKVDWKSRGADSKHGAYPEEGAQVAAYARAQYVIEVDQSGDARRATVPAYDGALIVSIKPDGCRVYPVDLDKAWEHFSALHSWWVARRDERSALSRSWASKTAPKPSPPIGVVEAVEAPVTVRPAPEASRPTTTRQWIMQRVEVLKHIDGAAAQLVAMWPAGVPGLKSGHVHTDDELDLIEAAVTRVERNFDAPFTPGPRVAAKGWVSQLTDDPFVGLEPPPFKPVLQPVTLPDEGGLVGDDDIALVEFRLSTLTAAQRAWCATIAQQAVDAGAPIALKQHRSERRFAIVAGVIAWADYDDELVRAGLEYVAGAPLPDATTTGAVIATLAIGDALTWAELAGHLNNGTAAVTIDNNGTHITPNPNQKEPSS